MVSVIALSIVIVVSVSIVVKLTGEIISPLKDLAVTADEVAGGNFDTELLQVQSEDEIGVVTGAFNQMLISIRQYLESLRESMEIRRSLMEKELLMEAHLKDAQLKYLQAQINPHFLFNTLNAGAQLAMMEGADRTYEYVQNVAEFFRYNVKKSNDIVTVREELELVDHYIYILNVRFSGDIHYGKEIEEAGQLHAKHDLTADRGKFRKSRHQRDERRGKDPAEGIPCGWRYAGDQYPG